MLPGRQVVTDTAPMLLALLLAAGAVRPATVDGRISLLEARQMLESQQVWALRKDLPPETIAVLADVQLHVQHDQEQEDKVRDLTLLVAQMQARLTALEIVLADRSLPESQGRMTMQVAPLVVPAARTRPKKPSKAYKQAPAAPSH
jgi:hypothetical protein